MIIGEYAINALQVFYGRKCFVPGANVYTVEIHIISDDDIPEILIQYVVKSDDADAMMKQINECIKQREDAMLQGLIGGGEVDYDD